MLNALLFKVESEIEPTRFVLHAVASFNASNYVVDHCGDVFTDPVTGEATLKMFVRQTSDVELEVYHPICFQKDLGFPLPFDVDTQTMTLQLVKSLLGAEVPIFAMRIGGGKTPVLQTSNNGTRPFRGGEFL